MHTLRELRVIISSSYASALACWISGVAVRTSGEPGVASDRPSLRAIVSTTFLWARLEAPTRRAGLPPSIVPSAWAIDMVAGPWPSVLQTVP